MAFLQQKNPVQVKKSQTANINESCQCKLPSVPKSSLHCMATYSFQLLELPILRCPNTVHGHLRRRV